MSQITTCPSCSTRFRVVADQLRISDGWVRCGQCQEVFDARNHLNASVAAPIAPVAPIAAVPTPAQPAPSQPLSPSLEKPDAPLSAIGSDLAGAVVQSKLAVPEAMTVRGAPAASAPVPSQSTAAPPGYELPAPQWPDDIDFSEYQAGSIDTVEPREQPQSAVQRLAAGAPAEHSPAVVLNSVPPLRHTEATATAALPHNSEAAWNAAARSQSVAKDAFPPLDLSLLKVRASASAAVAATTASPDRVTAEPAVVARTALAAATDSSDEIAISSNTGALSKLPEHEQSRPMAAWMPRTRDPEFAALDSHLHADLQPAVHRHAEGAGIAAEVLEADVGSATLPQDEIESIAQKLAQMQPGTAAFAPQPETGGAFARNDFGDEAADALDSSLEPGFVREARRKAWWQKPLVRVAMGAGVVVLPVALALQVALHERNALASWQPSARPALEFMCTALQCKLAPRQQIRAMVVTGSAFAKGEPERSYQLSLSIQNQASTPVGVPAVELTLTDSQDQAIARKVIQTKELGAPVELAAGSEWSGTVPVTTEGLNLQVSGYRVLLFYP